MKQRAISAFFFVIAMVGGVFGGYIPFLALFGIITAGAAWELMKLSFGPNTDHIVFRKYAGALLACIPFVITGLHYLYPGLGLLSTGHHPWLLTIVVLSPFYVLWMVELLLASERPFSNIGHFLLGLVYVGIPLALLVDIAMPNDQYMPLRVFSILVLNWMNDTFAYLTGSVIGKTPFFPRISPKKTWEGTLGGIVCTVLIAWGAERVTFVAVARREAIRSFFRWRNGRCSCRMPFRPTSPGTSSLRTGQPWLPIMRGSRKWGLPATAPHFSPDC